MSGKKNWRYELTDAGISKQYPTAAHRTLRLTTLRTLILENKLHVAKMDRRISIQEMELLILERIEIVEKATREGCPPPGEESASSGEETE